MTYCLHRVSHYGSNILRTDGTFYSDAPVKLFDSRLEAANYCRANLPQKDKYDIRPKERS